MFGGLTRYVRKLTTRWQAETQRRRVVRALAVLRASGIDAAETTADNKNHWAPADNRSARAAYSQPRRQILRKRSRYEVLNNCWATGIVRTLAHHTIGLGPRLQILSPDPVANERVETSFANWATHINLSGKLLTLKETQIRDGECFGLLVNNAKQFPVSLNLRLYEADQVTNPLTDVADPFVDDGIRIDEDGDPVEYFFLDHHPGDPIWINSPYSGKWRLAKDVLHYFRLERPGQLHGIPDITPALPLFALLRRFVLATIEAAETAANLAAIIHTTGPAVVAAQMAAGSDYQHITIPRGAMLALPEGQDISQLKAEHPTSTYETTVRMILTEIARCLSMPRNIAMCDSSAYNYSSGRLDHLTYHQQIDVDRNGIETTLLNRIFVAWAEEAMFSPDNPLEGMPPISQIKFQWCWDSQPIIDEQTDAAASTERLKSGQSTLPLEWQRRGYGDCRTQLAKGAAVLGMSVQQYQAMIARSLFGDLPAPATDPATGDPANTTAAAPGAAAAPTAAGGEYLSLKRSQFKNASKAMLDILEQFASGKINQTQAEILLGNLGQSAENVARLIATVTDDGETSENEVEEALA